MSGKPKKRYYGNENEGLFIIDYDRHEYHLFVRRDGSTVRRIYEVRVWKEPDGETWIDEPDFIYMPEDEFMEEVKRLLKEGESKK